MYGKKQRFIPDLNQEYTMDLDILNSIQGLFPEGTNLFGSSFIGGGGGFGGSGSGGGTTGSIELTEEGVQAGTEDFIRNQITSIGLDPATFTSEQLTDATEFRSAFEPQKTKFLEDQRGSLYDLYKAGDTAEFSKIYDQLDTNSQLNLLHTLYEDDTLDKKAYLNLAATTLATEDARQYASYGLDEPMYQYTVVNDYDTGDRLYRYNTSSGPETAREVVLLEDQKYRGSARPDDYDGIVDQKETFLRELGTTNSEGVDKRSTWVSMRDDALIPMARIALAVATQGKSEQLYSAVRLASGETLHGEDYANLALGGLETANVITPPVNAATAAQAGTDAMNAANAAGLANAIEIGNAAQAAASAGTGLLGLSYGQTTQLIGAIGNQDPLNAALALSGNGLITDTLEAIGIPTELANDPDFIEGTTAALETAVAGGNLQDALQDGLVEYITEGGGFGGVPDLDFDGLASVLDPIVGAVETVGDALAPIFDSVEDIAQVVGDVAEDVVIDPADDIIDLLGSEVVDPILQAVEPVVNVIEDVVIDPIDDALDYVGSEVVDPVLQATEDVAQEVGDVIEDYVIDPVDDVLDFVGEEYVDPVAQTIGDVAEDIGQGVGDVVEDVAQVGGDVLEDIGQGVGDVVETVVDAIPDVDLPDVDLPDISLPNLGLPSVGLPQVVMPSSPSATRTTDTLFGDMLKLETKITPFQQALIQSQQQQQQMASLPATQQLVNYNRLGQFLQPTQPAEGLITGRRF